MVKTAKAPSVPKGTDTPKWLDMSARVAWIFWLTNRRANHESNPSEELDVWQEVSGDFRTLMRRSMRALAAEGIQMNNSKTRKSLSSESEEWGVTTARFAWILWLTDRRSQFPENPEQELEIWSVEGNGFRDYVRKSLKTCESEGMHLELKA